MGILCCKCADGHQPSGYSPIMVQQHYQVSQRRIDRRLVDSEEDDPQLSLLKDNQIRNNDLNQGDIIEDNEGCGKDKEEEKKIIEYHLNNDKISEWFGSSIPQNHLKLEIVDRLINGYINDNNLSEDSTSDYNKKIFTLVCAAIYLSGNGGSSVLLSLSDFINLSKGNNKSDINNHDLTEKEKSAILDQMNYFLCEK